jgi:hypothetical protein
VFWALQRLASQGAADVGIDLSDTIAGLLEHSQRFTDSRGDECASYFLGEAGILLLQ